ncbi:TatD family hydrolase [Myxococcota bacterium]|nr:TatD family hydrolase [Myxococcota bacterium]MBU1429713.1 TatD family hydrolase [Myxococcota bacterium]MBU1899799.1 TatD family hydrolase [Myxococcota bacterium]
MIPLIDSHAHLDFDRFDADREATLRRAAEAGVERVITIGTDLATSTAALRLAQARPAPIQIYATAGVHPHEAARIDDDAWPALEALLAAPEIVAVGEIGLDYYYDHAPRDRQRAVFERQLRLAVAHDLPVVIHVRDAFDDAFEALARVEGLRGVLHCFTGGVAEAERALALGLYLSFSGLITFKNTQDIQAAAAVAPSARILIETDAPFLAPVPKRGKRNEPAFVRYTAARLAVLRGIDEATLRQQLHQNTLDLFGL